MSLHCENIVKAYGGKEVLQDVTLEIGRASCRERVSWYV